MIPRDKLLHFFGGAWVYFHVAVFFNVVYAGAFTIAVACGIEIYQHLAKKGKMDPMDAFATILGGAETAIIIEIVRIG